MSILMDRIANDPRILLNCSDKIPYTWEDFHNIFDEESQLQNGFYISSLLATKLMMPKIMSRQFTPRGKDPANEIEDYVEECYMAILEKMPEYDPTISKFPAYISQTLVGVAGLHVREGHPTYHFKNFVTKYNHTSLDAPTRASENGDGEPVTLSECVSGGSMEETLSSRTATRRESVIHALALEKDERTVEDNYEFAALFKLLGGYEEWNDWEQERFAEKLKERRTAQLVIE
jgi:DNA-directed RNA polymerase specialized sigma24 family protein